MRTLFSILLIISISVSCRNASKHSVSQDFENVAGWFDTSKLNKGKGHSGAYFTHTGAGVEYGQTFALKMADITQNPIRRIDMGAWVRISEPAATARLVLSIESKDSTVFWQAIDTESASPKPGEWTRLFFTYDLPEGMLPDYTIKMFLWNRSNKTVDADDFDIHFYEK